jgi:hypothetical protein
MPLDVDDADRWLHAATDAFVRSAAHCALRHCRLTVEAPWLGDGRRIALDALYHFERGGPNQAVRVRALASDTPLRELADAGAPAAALEAVARANGLAIVDFGAPLPLAPVAIPKPWGQELWFSGIERRGQSRVVGTTGSTALPLALALGPRHLGTGPQPVLLKILDPWPDPVYGDLYLELHDVKQEVYLVTHVAPDAWPRGVGAVRYGIEPVLRARYADDDRLRTDFLFAVRRYEQIRRRIDALFEARRSRAGVAPDAVVEPAELRRWHAELPAELQADEAECRQAMARFTALVPLRVGDVLTVPAGVPHSLQHGVRVVEFQTPVYERRIIAFAQKVLTQPHWDSAAAIARMSLETPPAPERVRLRDDADCTAERVAAFEDFGVWRVALAPGASFSLPVTVPYVLCMAVDGGVTIGSLHRREGEACIVPAAALREPVRNRGNGRALCLLAAPGL